MDVLWAYADVHEKLNSSKWRSIIPATAIARAGHKVEIINIPQLMEGTHHFRPQDFDIIVAERELFRDPKRILPWLERVPILATFDDAYHLIPPSVITSNVWRKGKVIEDGKEKPVMTQFKKLLRKLDGYITPSYLLTEDFLTVNPHGYTIKNYPDLSWDCWQAPRREPDNEIRIVWGGSLTHYDSWRYSGIVPAIKRILEEYDNVSLTLITQDLRIRSLFAGIPPNKVRSHSGVPFEEWPRLLAKFDIGLAPLHGEYDRRRSWIKVLEYCMMGVFAVVSDYEPYHDTLAEFVLKPRSRMWHSFIVRVIEQLTWLREEPSRLEDAITHRRNWALQQGIDDHVHEYIEAFEDAIARRQNE